MGVIATLKDHNYLSEVREWYGNSGGSIAAIACTLGVSSSWLRDCVKHFDTRPLLNIQEDLILNFTTHWGVDSGKDLVEYVGRVFETWEPGFTSWTFRDISNARPLDTLYIPAVNVTTGEYVVFSANTHPDMKVLDAVRASSAIPFLFTPWIDASDNLYCDAGLIELFPWRCISPKRHAETLIIACSDAQISGRKMGAIHGFMEYMYRVCSIMHHKTQDPKHWIAVNNTTVGIVEFDLPYEKRLALFEEAVMATTTWLTKAAQSENSEMQQCSAGPHTSLSGPMTSAKKEMDIPGYQIPSLHSDPVRDSRISYEPLKRRWSL
jgi:hypothetical protein